MKYFYNQIFYKKYILPAYLLILVSFAGCEKFEGDQTVPAIIQIDTIGLVTEYDLHGSASHNIVDAWVYVDDQLVGAFELPAKVPVLAEGNHKVVVYAGIKLNGISATRVAYPFYKPIVKENYRLAPDSICIINESTTYYDNTKFSWMEDFESSVSIQETNQSDTVIQRTQNPLKVFEGNWSGLVNLTDGKVLYEGASDISYDLPGAGQPVFLEVNYKINNVVTFGLFAQGYTNIRQDAILNLNVTDEWKKIYINYTPAISRNGSAVDYKVFFGSVLSGETTSAELIIDNIKLVHR